MAKAKTASAKKASSSKRKVKEPIVEVEGVEPTDDVTFEAPEPPAVTEPSPNVIWSSERIYKNTVKDGEKETVNWVTSPTAEDPEGKLKFGDPPTTIKIGRETFQLEPADVQLRGFYHKHAFRLVRQFNGYKYFKPKG